MRRLRAREGALIWPERQFRSPESYCYVLWGYRKPLWLTWKLFIVFNFGQLLLEPEAIQCIPIMPPTPTSSIPLPGCELTMSLRCLQYSWKERLVMIELVHCTELGWPIVRWMQGAREWSWDMEKRRKTEAGKHCLGHNSNTAVQAPHQHRLSVMDFFYAEGFWDPWQRIQA